MLNPKLVTLVSKPHTLYLCHYVWVGLGHKTYSKKQRPRRADDSAVAGET